MLAGPLHEPDAFLAQKVRVDGKFFAAGGSRFQFRGVTYGTFAQRGDGALFPATAQVIVDFERMREYGFTVVRTYTEPPDDVLWAAARSGLRVMTDVFYPDWRYLVAGSRRESRRVLREARAQVREAARRLRGNPQVLALSLGNEVPADVIRWHGAEVVGGALRELAEAVREEDPDQLITYANYPTAEYLPLDTLDFLTFNVFLEQQADFRRYLTRLHHLAGDRPLVLGELGLSAPAGEYGERHQAEVLDWQMQTAVERGVGGMCVYSWTDDWWVGGVPVTGWRFGLTREDRAPRPALEVAQRWNGRTARDLDFDWPSISVVVCARNAETTIEECLDHVCALDYPELEVIVVDDGSTDATRDIAAANPWVRVIAIPHSGLAVARNEGMRAATGELVAYLDSDAYPSPEWPWYLALGLDAPDVAGVGGPNLPPVEDPVGAQVVARCPGGPVHVLTSDDRAEHVPGCNMAFWKPLLHEAGGFDPAYMVAGDDVDVCWRLIDREWKIGFHPAALVWHHRRPGLRAYLRQQHGYGRSEALVEARHPDRFTIAGSARWRGHIYNPIVPSRSRQRVYRGPFGTAPYQSVYRAGGDVMTFAHQLGVPLAVLALATAPLALASRWLIAPALAGLVALAALAVVDALQASPPRRAPAHLHRGWRLQIALHHLLQPLARTWGRWRHRGALREPTPSGSLPRIELHLPRGGVMTVEDRPRADLAAAIVERLRRAGARAIASNGWEDYDARLLLGAFLHGDLQTSSHPPGYVQARIRPRMRRMRAFAGAAALLGSALVSPYVAAVGALLVMAEVGRGVVRGRRLLPAAFDEACE